MKMQPLPGSQAPAWELASRSSSFDFRKDPDHAGKPISTDSGVLALPSARDYHGLNEFIEVDWVW